MTKKKSDSSSKKSINIILITLVVFLSLLQILLSNRIATEGKRLKILEEEIKKAQEDNLNIELEIVSNGRLHQLAKKAKSLGFVNNPSVINLINQVPVALKPQD